MRAWSRRLKAAALAAVTALAITPALPASPATAGEPRFQVNCKSSHLAQEDPIVAPGATSAHMHEFFGNRTTNKDSTYQSMLGQPTTCSTSKDTAGYWTPTLLDGNKVIRARSLLIYYRGAAGQRVVAFPPDLRMVSSRVHSASPENLIVKFPDCWNGKDIDSSDHISHMAFAGKSKPCPSSHPVRVPAITEVVRYPVNVSGKTLSSGSLSTMHADFWNTWDQEELEALTARCLNGSTTCPRIDD